MGRAGRSIRLGSSRSGASACAVRGSRQGRRLVLKGGTVARRARSGFRSSQGSMLRRLYDWTLSLAAQALGALRAGCRVLRRELVLSGPARRHAGADGAGAAGPGLVLRLGLHRRFRGGRVRRLPIGALLYDSLGAWLFQVYGLAEGAEAFRHAYAEYGHWIILLKGLTPIPYKLVTITSGFAGYDLFLVRRAVDRHPRRALLHSRRMLMSRYGPTSRASSTAISTRWRRRSRSRCRRFRGVPLPVLRERCAPVPDPAGDRAHDPCGGGRDDRRRARLPARLRAVAVQALPRAAHPLLCRPCRLPP